MKRFPILLSLITCLTAISAHADVTSGIYVFRDRAGLFRGSTACAFLFQQVGDELRSRAIPDPRYPPTDLMVTGCTESWHAKVDPKDPLRFGTTVISSEKDVLLIEGTFDFILYRALPDLSLAPKPATPAIDEAKTE